MFYKAKHRFADVSARKIRPWAQLVRGRNVDEALEQLRYVPNRGAKQLAEVIRSAVGNAEDQGCQNVDALVVTECRVDGGPMFKRMQPRARGTAFMIKKRLAHIVVTLTDIEALEASIEREVDAEETAAAPTGTGAPAQPAPATVPTAVTPEQPNPTA